MERWDLYDSERRPLFRTHERGEKKNPEEYHTAVEVWTVNSKNDILVTLRDPQKEEYPDKWENTGGSALAGETSRQAAVRELMEETGISAAEDDFIFLGTNRDLQYLEFVDIYLLRCDLPISELTMQAGETVAAKWITLAQLEAMIEDRSLALPIGRRFNYIKKDFLKHFDAS